jgi:uncharacterized protein (DUF362 family)
MAEVSIAKCLKVNDVASLKKELSNAIELLGGLKSRILKGDSVLIKPNVLAPMSYETGATTNPFLVEALIELLQEYGIKKITIGEGSAVGLKTDESFEAAGWYKLAEKKGVKIIDFKKEEFIPMSVPEGKVFRILYAPKVLVESDIIINVPVMKTHDTYPATLGLKNMKGVLREKDKKRFHLWKLSQCIVDLNKLLLPHITIEDGTVGMEGYGPMFGIPANRGIIIASFDVVAADTVAAQVMGFDPDTIEYLKLAVEQNLGCGDMSDIKVLGLGIKDFKKKFETASLEEEELKKYNIRIIASGACSGCRATLDAYIYRMQRDKILENIKNYTFLLGQNVELPEDVKGPVVKYGACIRAMDAGTISQELFYIQGCPPHPDTAALYIKSSQLY